jgi:3-oxoacyl-[acyl-carrier protein] reductase
MKDTVTIVTGAAQGIGRAIAELLAEKGGNVALFDILDGSPAAKAIEDKGGRASFYQVDVTEYPSVEKGVGAVLKDFGRVTNLVNNAGITRDGLFVRMKEEDWDRVMLVNLKGAFNCTKAVLRHMLRTGGGIVNLSSVTGIMGNAGQANYSASKAGLIGLTKSLAKEYGERNIRVNAVAPGFINTDMTGILDDTVKAEMLKGVALKRAGEPVDVARAVYFLLSEYGAYVTGEVINVSGGLHM